MARTPGVHLDPGHAEWAKHRSQGAFVQVYTLLARSHGLGQALLRREGDADALTRRQPAAP
jgi:hypothetical protein